MHHRHPAFPFVKPQRHPNSLVLVVKLVGAPSRRVRRAFFARMYQEARRLGILLSHKQGVCVLFGAERICTNAHRHQMVAWLIDQDAVDKVSVGSLEHLAELFAAPPRLLLEYRPVAWVDFEPLRGLLQQAAGGAITQWVRYVSGVLS